MLKYFITTLTDKQGFKRYFSLRTPFGVDKNGNYVLKEITELQYYTLEKNPDVTYIYIGDILYLAKEIKKLNKLNITY